MKIAKALGDEALDMIDGTSLDNTPDLKALAKMKDQTKRDKLIARAATGEKVSTRSKKPKAKKGKYRSPRSPMELANVTLSDFRVRFVKDLRAAIKSGDFTAGQKKQTLDHLKISINDFQTLIEMLSDAKPNGDTK